MKVTETKIPGVLIVDTDVFGITEDTLQKPIQNLNMKKWELASSSCRTICLSVRRKAL